MLYYCISTVIQGVRNVAWQFNGREAVFVQIADKLRNDKTQISSITKMEDIYAVAEGIKRDLK